MEDGRAAPVLQSGLLLDDDGNLVPTERGMLLLNELVLGLTGWPGVEVESRKPTSPRRTPVLRHAWYVAPHRGCVVARTVTVATSSWRTKRVLVDQSLRVSLDRMVAPT